jgi:CubicO group peptidase (beta-lactamase class C family)
LKAVPVRPVRPSALQPFSFFWVDPKEKLVAVMMVQTPQGTNVPNYRQARTMVYQALTN